MAPLQKYVTGSRLAKSASVNAAVVARLVRQGRVSPDCTLLFGKAEVPLFRLDRAADVLRGVMPQKVALK